MALTLYNKKRNFKKTPEPAGERVVHQSDLIFVVQKHDASHLHYDFRLEMEGVLKSWAVPKGPSMDPRVKRLAVEVEDHPFGYRDFEGSIPEGNYGAGQVIVWDTGPYSANGGEKALLGGLKKGRLTFTLQGKKLKGEFSLVRTKRSKQWLLIKKDDDYASVIDVLEDDRSVLSARSLATTTKEKTNAATKKAKPRAAKRSLLKADLRPMLATLATEAFDNPDWIYEVKWDGYRVIIKVEDGVVELLSRSGKDVTQDYPLLADAVKAIKTDVVIDGELVALDKGKPNFQLLQQARRQSVPLAYYAFDLLSIDGEDIRNKTLLERKEILEKLIPHKTSLKKNQKSVIKFSEHIVGKGVAYFKAAQQEELEGIMAKRAASTYRSGKRSEDWLKIKTEMRQEAVIVGYTNPKGSREYFGSLVIAIVQGAAQGKQGEKQGENFVYAGRVGTGFDTHLLKDLYNQLTAREIKKKPISSRVPDERSTHWVKPELICEIKFTEWTRDNEMRHPVFMGLRNDKKPKEVSREQEKETAVLVSKSEPFVHTRGDQVPRQNFTNRDKVFWPGEGYTKGDLIDYYQSVAPIILPHLKDRAESLNRHPSGILKPGFFQKNVESSNLPDFVKTTIIHAESTDEDVHYLVCDNEETLLYLANLGCIEINPWASRIKNLDKPDWFVIDLDPGENTFDQVVEVARTVKDVLDQACEKSYVKTSGKTGLHICVPLHGRYTYEQVEPFAHAIARVVESRLPNLTSLERSPKKRLDKIYLDYLQNKIGATIAAPYSVRPVAGACVSTPLRWSEVKKGLDPKAFTIKSIGERIKKHGDLWAPVLKETVDLKQSIVCLEKMLPK